MSCWRVLELSDHTPNHPFPQLLVKPHFERDAYTVHLTDLSNIWSEELSLTDIVERASLQESPIEVSKHDTTQLAILLENIKKSLVENNGTSCRITRANTPDDSLVLLTTTTLPEPLDSLHWQFCLRKRSPVILRNELILPLLLSSHIQHERISRLAGMISDKDKAITRLMDQFESSNLDLAVAFPSIGGMKKGGRVLRREQAAKYVPGLSAFEKSKWERDTAELRDSDVSTIGLFREALEECTPKVPLRLMSEDGADTWWIDIDSTVGTANGAPRSTSKNAAKPVQSAAADSETETEDEFETHENFKLRGLTNPAPKAPVSSPPAISNTVQRDITTDDDDDGDLNAPPRSQSQAHKSQTMLLNAKSPTPEPPLPSKEITLPPPPMPKAKGFRIGGREKSETPPPAETHEDDLPTRPESDPNETSTAPKPVKKSFKIGGRSKATSNNGAKESTPALPEVGLTENDNTPMRAAPTTTIEDIAMPDREETSEEKAERKRLELKRKNEELSKKQATSKKKKRF